MSKYSNLFLLASPVFVEINMFITKSEAMNKHRSTKHYLLSLYKQQNKNVVASDQKKQLEQANE